MLCFRWIDRSRGYTYILSMKWIKHAHTDTGFTSQRQQHTYMYMPGLLELMMMMTTNYMCI